ncbi:DUF2778 domain-containing protein [Paraburkholderia sp. D15]|uniref:DUF2778 domain-containing protein n=1 Tax=Paraburkholderia sp. D15 TaxID=2880218 RepID=UPI002478E148|nr:DUF2778 domain-containing protein [Paraburkholderia sp. D15]WGS52993.1 DUF2778 domain-containing protein [Paraburkholderia sp. D15]WKF61571.1 hypothetical protein HUO10_006102 [Paraburkholderia busanensis]
MPVSCSFRLNGQRMSVLLCPGLGGIAAFSGDGIYVDDPSATAKKDEGPLPAGTYFIVDRESGGRLGWLRDTIANTFTHTSRSGWFALYRNDGLIDDYTYINGVLRGEFRLHPAGRTNQSKGCITVHNRFQFEKLRTFLKSQPRAVIPGTNISYYGTVNVR